MSTKEEVLSRLARNTSVQTDSEGGILIGDKYINNYVEMNNPSTPAKEDYLLIIKVPSDGSAKKYVKYTVSELITALGKEATDAMNAAIEANTNAQAAYSAIQLIQAEVNNAVQGFDTSVEQATSSALSDISEAKESAVSEIEGKVHVGYRTTIGDGTTKTFTITHGLNCDWVVTQVWYPDQDKQYPYIITEKDRNTLEISFYIAPETGTEVRIISNERVSIAELPENIQITPDNLGSDVLLSASEISEIIFNAEA